MANVRCTNLEETLKAIEECNVPEIYGDFIIDIRTNLIIIVREGSPTFRVYDKASPEISVYGSSTPEIRTFGSSYSLIETHDSSSPTIYTYDLSCPTILTLDSSQAILKKGQSESNQVISKDSPNSALDLLLGDDL